MQKTHASLAVALALSCAPLTINAQETPDGADVEKVVVYGQKIQRTLQETKESVAVISEDFIDDIALLDLEDAYLAAANVFTLSNGENFGIRGVTQNSASTGGGNGELGSFYMDGVAYTGFATRFGPRDLWDVKQIEILRGPQSTNVGRQALIGAVVVTTNDPDLSGFEGGFRAEYGNYNTRSLEGMLNLVVSENSALRITAETYKSDGYIENITTGDDKYDSDDNTLLRAKYLIEPTDDFSALFTVQYAEKEIGWDIYRTDLVPDDSYQTSSNLDSFETYEGTSAALDLNYDINDSWALRSVTSYINGDYDRFNDDDAGPEGGDAFRGRTAEDTNWAQEVRLTYESDTLSGVMGLYYTDVEVVNDTTGIVSLVPSSLGVPPVLLPFYPSVVTVDVLIPSVTQTKNKAFFTEWDWKVAEDITLSAGFRYDREELEVNTNALNSLAPGSELPDPALAGQVAAGMGFDEATVAAVVGGITQVNALLASQLTPTNNSAQSTDFNAFLPQLGITYDIDDDTSVSAFYKRGYRAGGVDVDTVGTVDRYDAEYLDNLEFALRSVHLDGDLVFNANAYYGWWKDQQLTVYVNGSLFDTDTINAGESRLYGAEFELQYRVSDNTNIYASAGIAKTKFDEFCLVDGTPEDQIIGDTCQGGDGLGRDLSGGDFAYSPDVTLAFGGRHYFNDNWFIAGNVTYQDEAFSDIQNTPEFVNDSFSLVNLSAGYENGDFKTTLYVRNAFDEFYSNFRGEGIAGGDSRLVAPGVPRQFGILVSKQF